MYHQRLGGTMAKISEAGRKRIAAAAKARAARQREAAAGAPTVRDVLNGEAQPPPLDPAPDPENAPDEPGRAARGIPETPAKPVSRERDDSKAGTRWTLPLTPEGAIDVDTCQ